MDGGTRLGAGKRSRARRNASGLVALRRLPASSDRQAWLRGWRGAHGLTINGLTARLAAAVRVKRDAIRLTANAMRR